MSTKNQSEVTRIVSPDAERQDDRYDYALRPKCLDEYIGQHEVREQMQVFIEASKNRGEALDHTLIFGPPGLGKTTLAQIIANEMEVRITSTSGPILEKAGDLAAILTNLKEHDLLFIDEIHRLPPVVEEILYPAMEDYRLDIMIGEGPAARSIKLELPVFTLVGATTRTGLLTSPLLSRFGIVQRLNFYSCSDLILILKRSATRLGVTMDSVGANEIAKRSRGTPRVANRLLRRVRDYAEVRADSIIDGETAMAALDMLQVDSVGLDQADRLLLRVLIDKFDGGPVGVDTLVASINEKKDAIEDVIEPFLIQQGYLMRTPRGRVATPLIYKHFGLPIPKSGQAELDMQCLDE